MGILDKFLKNKGNLDAKVKTEVTIKKTNGKEDNLELRLSDIESKSQDKKNLSSYIKTELIGSVVDLSVDKPSETKPEVKTCEKEEDKEKNKFACDDLSKVQTTHLPYAPTNKTEKPIKEFMSYYLPKKQVNLYCIAIKRDLINPEKLVETIKKLGIDKIIKFFVFSENSLRTSDYISLDSINFEKDLLKFFSELEESQESINSKSKSLFYKIISEIDNEKIGAITELKFKSYEVDALKVIFYGSYDFKNEDVFSEEIMLKFDSIRKKSETSYYMTQDDTVILSALGFRNLYLLDRFNYEGVK